MKKREQFRAVHHSGDFSLYLSNATFSFLLYNNEIFFLQAMSFTFAPALKGDRVVRCHGLIKKPPQLYPAFSHYESQRDSQHCFAETWS
jgi:hypothetical protein